MIDRARNSNVDLNRCPLPPIYLHWTQLQTERIRTNSFFPTARKNSNEMKNVDCHTLSAIPLVNSTSTLSVQSGQITQIFEIAKLRFSIKYHAQIIHSNTHFLLVIFFFSSFYYFFYMVLVFC